MRVAFFHTELQRDGPGLLLRDVMRGEDEQVEAVIDVIERNDPDIIVLQGIDWDHKGRTAQALQDTLGRKGVILPHRFAAPPNTGLATEFDLNNDGKRGGPADAQGYGRFRGQGALLVLSRFPIVETEARDFSDLIWADQPGTLFPFEASAPGIADVQRLSSNGHWIVPIDTPSHGRLTLGTFAASPPVFDGPEDRNGRRNHDEILFWTRYLQGDFGPPETSFVLAGNANQDPNGGEGIKHAITSLLRHPNLQDPGPQRPTVDWPDPTPGDLRVSYILPAQGWHVAESGIDWPQAATPESAAAITASRHRLIWADLTRAP